MLAFEQYLRDTAAAGGAINTMFEERIFALVGILESIAVPLDAARIPYELIGGGAVMVHVDRIDNSAVRNTKDLDIMVNRADLDHIRFTFRRAAGLGMLMPAGETNARNAVHLVFTGERVRPDQALPNPALRPERLSMYGVEVAVIPVADLVGMKLSSHRHIDIVHVDDMDQVGLITPEVEQALVPVLWARLEEIRRSR
jgi:hypothetical protein